MRRKRYEALSARISALEERVNGLDLRADSHDADAARNHNDLTNATTDLWAAVRKQESDIRRLISFLMENHSTGSIGAIQGQLSDLMNWRQQIQPLLNAVQWSTEKKGGE